MCVLNLFKSLQLFAKGRQRDTFSHTHFCLSDEYRTHTHTHTHDVVTLRVNATRLADIFHRYTGLRCDLLALLMSKTLLACISVLAMGQCEILMVWQDCCVNITTSQHLGYSTEVCFFGMSEQK